MRVIRQAPWLIVGFLKPHQALSWAIVGGGFTRTTAVSWLEVCNQDLPPDIDPRQFLSDRMAARGLENTVGLLTSRKLDAYVDVEKSYDGISARCIATVGLSNSLRAGDPPSLARKAGTVNILCRVSLALSQAALLESLAIAVEARTAAILASEIPSFVTGLPATGTGTDCVVMISPEGEPAEPYAGKHTAIGHAVGAAVFEAVAQGAGKWKEEWSAGRIQKNAGEKGLLCSGIK